MYYLIFMHYLCFREVVTSLLAVSRFLRNACFSTLQPDWGKNNKVVKLYMVFPYKTFEVEKQAKQHLPVMVVHSIRDRQQGTGREAIEN